MKTPASRKPCLNAVETARVVNTLVAILRATPSTSKALSKSTGCSVSFINYRLSSLSVEGRAFREGRSLPNGGKEYVWSAPPAAVVSKPAYPTWEVLAAFYGMSHKEAA